MTVFSTGDFSYRQGKDRCSGVSFPSNLFPTIQLPSTSTYRTPFSRYSVSSRAQSIPVRSLRSPTPSLTYYRRALSSSDLRESPVPVTRARPHSSRRMIQINEDQEMLNMTPNRFNVNSIIRMQASYSSVLEEIKALEAKYKRLNTSLNFYKQEKDHYAHLKPEAIESKLNIDTFYPASKASTIDKSFEKSRFDFAPIRSLPEKTQNTEFLKSQAHKYEMQVLQHYREASSLPLRKTRTEFQDKVKNPARYLAANLSTAVYRTRPAPSEPIDSSGMASTSTYRAAPAFRTSQSPGSQSSTLAASMTNLQKDLKPPFVEHRQPRELRLAQLTYDYVKHATPERTKDNKNYSKPCREHPFIIGI